MGLFSTIICIKVTTEKNGKAFSNIKNNPIPQFVTFGKVLETRHLKLEPIEEINGNQKTSIAEFSVVIP